MANICLNNIRFNTELTKEQLETLFYAICLETKITYNGNSISKATIAPHKLLNQRPTLSSFVDDSFRKQLGGRTVDLEEMFTLFYQINPIGMDKDELLHCLLDKGIPHKYLNICGINLAHENMYEAMYKILNSYKDEELVLKIEKFGSNSSLPNEKGFHMITCNYFDNEEIDFNTRWSEVSERWFERFLNIVARKLGKSIAENITLYFEEGGCDIHGLMSAYWCEEDGLFYVNVDNDYSEIEPYEEEEEDE